MKPGPPVIENFEPPQGPAIGRTFRKTISKKTETGKAFITI